MTTTRQTIIDLFDHFCEQEGITNYDVEFNGHKSTVAYCAWGTRQPNGKMLWNPWKHSFTFKFSTVFMGILSREEIVDTVIHEVAHALTGPHEKGHGAVWRAHCHRMGGTGKRCTSTTTEQKEAVKKWKGICPGGHVSYRDRLTEKSREGSCARCSNVYNPRFRYEWTQLR